ncbi:glycosyltransferase family 2 protein [Paraburkholderia hayleyella]|uniref:glycosyltransferase family 2 protein n=1 Tax=Paraburkholderia hayleyella TaxID=2152889 RepID=UPI001290BEBF|nr:glycosyltransferase family 2 protein [Paraburkholderia hayleyella]
MLNIVITMAGSGNNFTKEGYATPKPLIPLKGIPMIRVVINNLRPACEHQFIFICQKADVEQYGLAEKLEQWAPGCRVIGIDGLMEGAACAVLAAREFITPAEPLMIANGDQYVDVDINDYLADMSKDGRDGMIMTITSSQPKWQFFCSMSENIVTNVTEKQIVPAEAAVGIYNFRKGGDFIKAVTSMIKRKHKAHGEYYVALAYNEMIRKGARIGIHNIGQEAAGMYGLGIPEELDLFLSLPVCSRALENMKWA